MDPSSWITQRARTGVRGGGYICRHYIPVLIRNRLSVLQITTSLEMLDKDSPPAMPTGTASTSHILESEPYRTVAYLLILTLPKKP